MVPAVIKAQICHVPAETDLEEHEKGQQVAEPFPEFSNDCVGHCRIIITTKVDTPPSP